MTKITHRASSCPRIVECGASTGGDVHINESNEVAAVGTCVHEMVAEMITQDAPTMPNPERFLKAHNVENSADDIRFLSLRAHRLWHGFEDNVPLKKYFPNPIVEIKRSKTVTVRDTEVTLSGHMDLATYCLPTDDDHAIICDWKTGYKSEAHRYVDQMKAYAYLQACESKKVQRVTAIIGWLRDGFLDVMEYTRADLAAWAKKFFTQDIWWDGKTYSPGWACDYCPRKHSCPGRCEMIVGGVQMFAPGGDARGMKIAMGDGRVLSSEQFDMAVNMAKHVKGAVEKFLALAKISCEEHGPFPHPDGEKQWVVRERSGKTTINVDEAWTTLTKYMTVEQLSAVVTVGKTALEKALRASTDKGKQKLVEMVFSEMDDVGAITRAKPSKIMELQDIPKETT